MRSLPGFSTWRGVSNCKQIFWDKNKGSLDFTGFLLCRRWDLNPHSLATTGTWSLRVCHSATPANNHYSIEFYCKCQHLFLFFLTFFCCFPIDFLSWKWYYNWALCKNKSQKLRKCRNWQTSKTKDLVAFVPCGFKSHLPHWLKSEETYKTSRFPYFLPS